MAGYGKEKDALKAPKAPKLRSIEAVPAENGGFVAKHHFFNGMGPGYKESEEHAFGPEEGAKLLAHIGQHLGIDKTMKEGEADGE